MIFAVPLVVAVPAFAAGLAAAVLGKNKLLKKGSSPTKGNFKLWPELAEVLSSEGAIYVAALTFLN